MYLVRIDPDDGALIRLLDSSFFFMFNTLINQRLTIFFMHLPDLPGVSALLDDIVVEFIPQSCGSELRPGKFGKWIKIDAIDIQAEDVEDKEKGKQFEQGGQLHNELIRLGSMCVMERCTFFQTENE